GWSGASAGAGSSRGCSSSEVCAEPPSGPADGAASQKRSASVPGRGDSAERRVTETVESVSSCGTIPSAISISSSEDQRSGSRKTDRAVSWPSTQNTSPSAAEG